jgi:hypothetical protein
MIAITTRSSIRVKPARFLLPNLSDEFIEPSTPSWLAVSMQCDPLRISRPIPLDGHHKGK